MPKTTIEINRQKHENDLIYKALLPDIKSTDRAKITITSKDNLKIHIQAEDTTSLRAAVNTILRQIKLIEDTLKIGEKNDTKRHISPVPAAKPATPDAHDAKRAI